MTSYHHPVAQEAGVGDHGVQAPERVERQLDQLLSRAEVGHVVRARHRGATGLLDLGDDEVRGRGSAVGGLGPVVDHNRVTLGSQLQGVGPPDAASGSGDDRSGGRRHQLIPFTRSTGSMVVHNANALGKCQR
jgi:hypothetical protein